MRDPHRQRAWQALGLGPLWVPRTGDSTAQVVPPALPAATTAQTPIETTPETTVPAPHQAAPSGLAVATAPGEALSGGSRDERWQALRLAVEACRRCPLGESRNRAVFGSGSPSARWLLVGEAPGREEDQTGEPFVGQSGRLLDRMLVAAGLDRERDVFIANTLKCRPPNNRTPAPGEIEACRGHLAEQIRLLQPDIVLALGRPAAQTLLQTDASISSLRGKVHNWRFEGRTIPLVCTYHPAYLLRTPADKRKVWEDLCLAVDALAAHPDASGPPVRA